MMRPARWMLAPLALLLLAGSTAWAAAIPTYTVTDLGVGTARLSGSGSDATLTSPDGGATYAFPRTDNRVANTSSLLAQFPPFTDAPVEAAEHYGGSRFAYSRFDPSSSVFLNRAGEFAATNIQGIEAQSVSFGITIYTATRQPDGSFGPLSPLWGSVADNPGGMPSALILDLNNSGQALGVDTRGGPSLIRDYFVYDLHSRIRTELNSLLPPDWYVTWSTALDDQGRILLDAERYPNTNDIQEHTLLLTPAGLSTDPIPTPEPSSLATLAVTGSGLAYRRLRNRQNHS